MRQRPFLMSLGLVGLTLGSLLWAQERKAGTVQPRQLAPGVETIAVPEVLGEEQRDQPDIWVLEFAYKPPRFITVEVPDNRGRLQRKRIWYLAYRVTNRTGLPRLFVPQFTLVSTDNGKHYEDKVIPLAQKAVARREDPARNWENSASIVGIIPPTPEKGLDVSVYGVATWEGVDPEADHISIYVSGLSNGYRLRKAAEADSAQSTQESEQEQGAKEAEDAQNTQDAEDVEQPVLQKTLELKFWRPGDEFFAKEREIQSAGYEWIHR